jgi:hypothetical protein
VATKFSQLDTRHYEHHLNLDYAGGNSNAYATTKALSTNDVADLDHESEFVSKDLTTEALHLHDQTYTALPMLYNFLDAGRGEHTTSLQVEGTTTISNRTLFSNHFQPLVDSRHQTQSQSHSATSISKRADSNSALCQGTCRWPRPSDGECIMATPGHNECDSESLLWGMDPSQELTAWGNELAGIGEQLAETTNQDYVDGDEFVVD